MYTVKELARITGLTSRTLRYYDAIGLLCPVRDRENDYRLYGPREVNRLQEILLYREMGLPLEEIGRILDAPGYDRGEALRGHLDRLLVQRRRVEELIHTVRRTLESIEGGTDMSDAEKFEHMKRQAVQENEETYGREARERYGDQAVAYSGQRLTGMSREEWEQMRQEEAGYKEALRRAAASGDPAGEDAREAVRLHAAWVSRFWQPGTLTPSAHVGLVDMYGQDPRFTDYYEAVAPGAAAFFARAVRAYYGV